MRWPGLQFVASLWRAGFLCPERATQFPREDVDAAGATSRRERASARRMAATRGNEDGTEEGNRTHARTAQATKRAESKTPLPDTGNAPKPAERDRGGRPGTASACFRLLCDQFISKLTHRGGRL